MKTNRGDARKEYWRNWTEEELLEYRARQRPSPGKVTGTMRLTEVARPALLLDKESTTSHRLRKSSVGALAKGSANSFHASLPTDAVMDNFGEVLTNDVRPTSSSTVVSP